MTSSETRLDSREGRVRCKMGGNLFVDSPIEEGDNRGSFPIFGDLRRYEERLNRLVIGVATIVADHFRKRVQIV